MNPARRTTATALVLATAGGVLYATAVPASAAASCASPRLQTAVLREHDVLGHAEEDGL